ncbi:peptide deformylase, partial [Candidatus Daviesbacteria bacterium]|nr:peptide deformylase [Candidatus Daviesbacteria bacterium]
MEVIKAPDPRLRIQTKQVKKINPALLQTLQQMIKLTKSFKEPEGVGLASTQIGLDEAFFVAKDGGRFIKVINPKILSFGKRTKRYFEGCLSTPNIWGE